MFLRRVVRLVMSFSCVVAAAAAAACSQRDARTNADSAGDRSAANPASLAAEADWLPELGQLLVVPSDSDNAAVVLYPAAPSSRLVSSAPLTLLNANGDTLAGRLALTPADSQQCGDAPIVHLSGNAPATWAVGLLQSAVRPLRMDSIEAMPSADSARFAADLARLASALPVEKDSKFTGLPFVVLGARRFEAAGLQMAAAHLVRRLPQEATPLEEHILLLAERSASQRSAEYALAYHERSEGREETADHYEILSALRGRESTYLVVARDQEARTQYVVFERTPTGGWKARWTRNLAC